MLLAVDVFALLAGPALIVVPGLLTVAWAVAEFRRRDAARGWTKVEGRIVGHHDSAGQLSDVIEYPLAEGGVHRLTTDPHSRTAPGRPLGTPVPVWRHPRDGLTAVPELPGIDQLAFPVIIGALGMFFAVSGLFWAVLILTLAS